MPERLPFRNIQRVRKRADDFGEVDSAILVRRVKRHRMARRLKTDPRASGRLTSVSVCSRINDAGLSENLTVPLARIRLAATKHHLFLDVTPGQSSVRNGTAGRPDLLVRFPCGLCAQS